MEQAFKDLRALMGKAQDMVTLAERFRGKSGADRDSEEAMDADMENELISLGIASPVTKTTAGALYHQQLSRQVSNATTRNITLHGSAPVQMAFYYLACALYCLPQGGAK